jgi:endonuclease-3
MTPIAVNKIFAIFAKQNPEPHTELHYNNNFELLVAVILSAQATDVSVNKVTPTLFKIASTPEKMLELGETALKKHISSIGLFNSKASNIIKASKRLVEVFHSKVPNTLEDLISLPGVGRKTANVVLNAAFGEATIPVDTHVFRVANRIGLAHAKTPLQTEEQLLTIIPSKYLRYAGHWLILHGRYICKARKPLCEQCPINKYCDYFHKSF